MRNGETDLDRARMTRDATAGRAIKLWTRWMQPRPRRGPCARRLADLSRPSRARTQLLLSDPTLASKIEALEVQVRHVEQIVGARA